MVWPDHYRITVLQQQAALIPEASELEVALTVASVAASAAAFEASIMDLAVVRADM